MIPVCLKKGCYETGGLTFRRWRYRKDGTRVGQYICRFHNTEEKRLERKKNPTSAYRAIKKYREKNKKRELVRKKARRKIPLKPCEMCGNPKAVRHHDDYDRPLDVRFLCHFHHRQVHPAGSI